MTRFIYVVGEAVKDPARTRAKTLVGQYTLKRFKTKMNKPWELKLDTGEKLIDDRGQDVPLEEWHGILKRFKRKYET